MREGKLISRRAARISIGVALTITVSLAVLLATAASARAHSGSVTVNVIDVHPSPGVWSGIEQMSQEVDVVVKRSSDSRFVRGDRVEINIVIVKGSSLFERESPKLDASKVSAGKLLMIRTKAGCAVEISQHAFSIDPSCISPIQQ